MKTYKVTPFNDQVSYTVTLDGEGVVSVEGIDEEALATLQAGVNRHIERRALNPVAALTQAVGSYATVEDVTDTV